MAEHTGSSYAEIAAKYADTIDSKPFTIFFERPAFVSLLPDLADLQVLEVGCGSGWYTQYLLEHGAEVVAFDYNLEFVRRTQERVGEKALVLQANLAEPLSFAADASFNLIVCPLVMHYIKDWLPVFLEFHRVLKPGGKLVFSTHHPFMDWQEFKTGDYFAIDLIEDEWDVGKVEFYRRPLTKISADLEAAGFLIERLLEPQPLEAYREVNPDGYNRLMKNPWRVLFRVCKA